MRFKNVFSKIGTLLFLIVMVIIFSITNESFLTESNIMNILRQISMLGIVSVGMTFVMISGGVDLSVSSLGALAGIIAAKQMVDFNINPILAVLITLVFTAAVGLINGLLIVNIQIPAFIATLGTYTILRGACYIITGGLPVFGFTRDFNVIGGGYLWIIPIPVIILLVILALGYVFLHKTYTGRYIFAVGGNEEAARLSGINTGKIRLLVYSICGFLAGVAGIIMLSRLASGQPSIMTGFELEVITAVVLGGVSFTGGDGKIIGMIQGVLILGVLSNGLILMDIDMYWQWVVNGVVLLLAVGLDKMSRKNQIQNITGQIEESGVKDTGKLTHGE